MNTNVIINKIEDGMTGCQVANLLLKNFESIVKALDTPELKLELSLSTSSGSENKILSLKVVSENINRLDAEKIEESPIDGNTYVRKNNNWVLESKGEVLSVLGRKGNVVLSKSDINLNNVDNTSDADKPISKATELALKVKADKSDVQSILDSKGQPNGIATLNGAGQISIAQLPSYVDDVIEVPTYEDLPNPGEKGKIYVIVAGSHENNTYRWTGNMYIKMGSPDEISVNDTGVKPTEEGVVLYVDLSGKPIEYTAVSEAPQDGKNYVRKDAGWYRYPDVDQIASILDVNNKVDKEEGKSLIRDSEIKRLATLKNYDDRNLQIAISNLNDIKLDKSFYIQDLYKVALKTEIPTNLSQLALDDYHSLIAEWERKAWNNKVDSISGKQLSTNDYTTTEKNKLALLHDEVIIDNTSTFPTDDDAEIYIDLNGNSPAELLVPEAPNDKKSYVRKDGAWYEYPDKTTIASLADVDLKISDLINSAPATLDTLKELADAILNNKSAVDAINEAIANKVDKDGNKVLSTNDFTDALKNKLSYIEEKANYYVHPDKHSPSIIEQNYKNRFVTDAEKEKWDNKLDLLVSGTNIKSINDSPIIGEGNLIIADVQINSTGTKPNNQHTQLYVDLNGEETFNGTVIPEAPKDGNAYVRKDGAWYPLESLINLNK